MCGDDLGVQNPVREDVSLSKGLSRAQERYPKARPVWGTYLEEHDRIITTGGPLSWIELALHIIRRFSGPDIARLAADMVVAESQPISQRIYAAPQGFVNTRHPLLLRAKHIIRYKEPGITAENLAKELNISHRTLHRKLKLLTGENPKEFITRVRIESACVLLRKRTANISGVATKCGYRDDKVFRRVFSKLMGMTPTQYHKLASRSNP
ncbi:helix-turn-helix domain-containing protein [Rahnella selenatireducens]|uniref:helix-turn-helix domain-containing protein n=1 Tax=Rahnella selenatireducens TaxID=3389797 RepID=UPI003969A892